MKAESALPLNARLDHVARHKFKALLQMTGKLGIRPVEIVDERLEGIQLPEQILRSGTAIPLYHERAERISNST